MEKKAYEKVQQYEIHNLNQIILKFFQEVFIS